MPLYVRAAVGSRENCSRYNILVRANPRTLPKGLARELLTTITAGDHTLLLSGPLLIEVRRVLTYPNVQARWPLSEDEIDRYLTLLEAAGEIVDVAATSLGVISDPDDDPILQTAITGKADVLCTRDAAFTHPMGDRNLPDAWCPHSGRHRAYARASGWPLAAILTPQYLTRNVGLSSGRVWRRS